MKENKPILTYYTDGACSGNPGPGAFAVIRLAKQYFEITKEEKNILAYWYREENPITTNNRMELRAVIHALELAKAMPQYHYVINSDSAYVVNMCNDWIWKWQKAGWVRGKNKSIENLDLVKKLYELLNDSNIEVEIVKCSGHSGILENELVDAIAAKNISKFEKLIRQYDIEIDNFKKL